MPEKSWLNFHPEHRKDLAKSGLSLKTVLSHGIRSVPPREISRVLKHAKKLDAKVTSMLAFPYPLQSDEFTRYKLFFDKDTKVEGMRYYQPKGTGSRLYMTYGFINMARNADIGRRQGGLYITEGEKKALSLSQRGFAAAAIGGVWNFGEHVLGDLKRLNVRQLRYIPDEDVWGRDDLLKSIGRFNEVLKQINCQLIVIKKKGI